MFPDLSALTSLTGGGAFTPSANSKSGDSTSGIQAGGYTNNAAFTVGGSGSASSGVGAGVQSNTVLYVLAGLAALGILAAITAAARRA